MGGRSPDSLELRKRQSLIRETLATITVKPLKLPFTNRGAAHQHHPRRSLRIVLHSPLIDPALAEQLTEGLAVGVIAQSSDECRGGAETCQGRGDISGRAAQTIVHRLIHRWISPRWPKPIHQGFAKADHGWNVRHRAVVHLP